MDENRRLREINLPSGSFFIYDILFGIITEEKMEKSSTQECLLKKVEDFELAARKYGFYWNHISQLMEQIRSECLEVEEAWEKKDRPHLQEEIGDLIQAAVSLAVFCDLDPYETLLRSIEKCQKRYDTVVKLAERDGLDNLRQKSFEVLMSYWNRAKQNPIE